MEQKSKQFENLSMSWTACYTQLPLKNGRYLVWADKAEIAGFNLNAGKWKSENPLLPPFDIDADITHWRACPSAPD